MAQFAEAQRPEHLFSDCYTRANEAWTARHGWPLYLPLAEEDRHHLRSLRVPLTTEWQEFDGQLLSLAKLLIDSLNERELVRHVEVKPNDKGLTKLERFLVAKGIAGFEVQLRFLRALQELRSTSAAHRKGSSFTKACQVLDIDSKDLPDSFERILQKAVQYLQHLGAGDRAGPL